ncbi:unnamed protein product [Polarella glacialis]|uniref:Uncharacterized protein n=1 Tax=Polarella glacialis TaxID=89957 RepID=A0A813D8Q1_POLGL|nr:unnamed protein product [Polarella glacialis]
MDADVTMQILSLPDSDCAADMRGESTTSERSTCRNTIATHCTAPVLVPQKDCVSRGSGQRRFYGLQFVCGLLYWLLVRAKTGKHPYALSEGSVCTRPHWMPLHVLLFLHKLRLPLFTLTPVLLGIAAVKPNSVPVRVATALVATVYHLLESSVTNRHGEYLLLYNVWGMLLPDCYAQAASFGFAIHFVLSSGLAKLKVGGRSWMLPHTMQVYLDIYRDSRSSPPLSKGLSLWLAKRAWATRTIGIATIALECIVVPSTLLMPPAWRSIGSALMIAMHLGIASAMSGTVGLLFLTALPSYLVGFGCPAPWLSRPWCTAALVALLPSACTALRGRPLSESWPLTPISLFMWSGEQAALLSQALMTRDTRVVMCTAAAPQDIRGLPVVYSGFATSGELPGQFVVHDAVARVIGFTLAQGDLANTLVGSREDPLSSVSISMSFLQRLQSWLVREGRMIELSTGKKILRAFFVRVDSGGGRVAQVLMEGDDESSSNSDSSSSDSDSSSEEGGGGAPKKKKITQGKRLASFKKKQSSGDVTADKGEEEDTEQYVVNTRVRTPKMQAVADLLCRWWYVLPDWPPQDQAFYQPELEKRKLRQVTITEWEWVPEEDSHGRRKVYELSQFRGLFRDSTGNLHDLRPQETCPCFANMMKKELPDILDLLVTAYENQLKDLEKSTYNEEKLKKDLLVKLTRLKNKSYQAKQVGSAKGR